MTGRPLGDYERFSLARSEAGVAPIVAFTTLLPSQITSSATLVAVSTLLKGYPLLRCGIKDKNSKTPSFVSLESLKAEDVVAAGSGGSHAEVLKAAIEAGQRFDVEKGPLWRVWLGEPEAGATRVTLAVQHSLSDGTGTRNLFAELLTLLRTPATDETTTDTSALPPTLEGSIDCRTPPLEIVKAVFFEFVLPKLPSFFHPTPPPPTFLGSALRPPAAHPTALNLFSLPPSVVAGLKTAGKANGVNTLHPLLYTAALAVLSSLAFPSSSASDDLPSLRILGSTPFSLRDPSLGHPALATGNYVAGITLPYTLPSFLNSPFWSTASDYAKAISDPAAKPAAAKRMGMLGLLPDMEGWVREQVEKKEYQETFEVSNLGVLPATGWEGEEGFEEVYWAQTASAFISTMAINPVAVRGGALTFSVSYRQGVIEEDTAVNFWAGFEALLRRVAEGGVNGEATIRDAAQ